MTFRAGDRVLADLPPGRFEGVIEGFNSSGMSALITLASPVAGYPQGAQVPVPVRLLERFRGKCCAANCCTCPRLCRCTCDGCWCG
jgi:hypothetical protein